MTTAVIGRVTYTVAGIDTVQLGFAAPVSGRNAVTATLRGPRQGALRCIGAIGTGVHPAARYALFSPEDIGPGAVVVLLCAGHRPGPRYLEGRPAEGTVGLAPHATGRFPGTRWRVHDAGGGAVTLECLGAQAGLRVLRGHPDTGTVAVAPTTDRDGTGTHWEITKVAPLRYTLRRLDAVDELRFLDGRPDDGSVGLTPATDGDALGTRWTMLRW